MAKQKAKEKEKKPDRKFRAWYTHELLELTLAEIRKYAKEFGIELADPKNPTPEELAEVYKEPFAEMNDPWEITANGDCKVEEMPTI